MSGRTDSRLVMKSTAQRKTVPPVLSRLAYRSLQGWALGILIEHGAVTECEHHGHRRDRSDPDALYAAREEARLNPFPGTTPAQALAALDEVMRSIGDQCPDC